MSSCKPGYRRRRGAGQGAAGPREGGDRALQISAAHRVRATRCRAPRRASCSASRSAGWRPAKQRGAGEAAERDVVSRSRREGAARTQPPRLARRRAAMPTACGGRAADRYWRRSGRLGREGRFPPDFVAQVRQALREHPGGAARPAAGPEHVVRLTWYVCDVEEYPADLRGARRRSIARSWGGSFPAMAVVQVVRAGGARGAGRDRGDGDPAGLRAADLPVPGSDPRRARPSPIPWLPRHRGSPAPSRQPRQPRDPRGRQTPRPRRRSARASAAAGQQHAAHHRSRGHSHHHRILRLLDDLLGRAAARSAA